MNLKLHPKTVTLATNTEEQLKTNSARRAKEHSNRMVKAMLEAKLNKRLAKPVQPPFTALQSFNAAALILSFVDYQEEVEPLLN